MMKCVVLSVLRCTETGQVRVKCEVELLSSDVRREVGENASSHDARGRKQKKQFRVMWAFVSRPSSLARPCYPKHALVIA